MIRLLFALIAMLTYSSQISAHSIYKDLHRHGPDSQLCCGDNDCAPVFVKIVPGGAQFFVGGAPWGTAIPKEWVFIPNRLITWLPIPNEAAVLAALPDPPEGTQYGHFCAAQANDTIKMFQPENIFGGWNFFCAYVTPGSI